MTKTTPFSGPFCEHELTSWTNRRHQTIPRMSTVNRANGPSSPPSSIPWTTADRDLVITARFDHVANLMKECPALCQEGRFYSYIELRDHADRIASHLYRQQTSGRVVLYLTSSFDHFAAALGAMKAGWITIPMDPGYPSKRIGQILGDAKPDMILTYSPNRDALWQLENDGMRPKIHVIEELFSHGTRPPVPGKVRPETTGTHSLHVGIVRLAQGRPAYTSVNSPQLPSKEPRA